jgi:hypothetical protein
MNKQQAHDLKLKIALFAQASAMLEHAKDKGQAQLDLALAERDATRKDVYSIIDKLTEETK